MHILCYHCVICDNSYIENAEADSKILFSKEGKGILIAKMYILATLACTIYLLLILHSKTQIVE